MLHTGFCIRSCGLREEGWLFFPGHFWFELLKIHLSLLHINKQFLT